VSAGGGGGGKGGIRELFVGMGVCEKVAAERLLFDVVLFLIRIVWCCLFWVLVC